MGDLFIALNWWAVIVAAVVYFLLGAVWYSVLFANKWMELRELKEEDISGPNPIIFVWTFILQFVATLSLALFILAMGVYTGVEGAIVGFGAGAGIVFTLAGTTGLFSGTKPGLHFIDNGYHVVGLTIAGAILGWW
jgi:hypothetical protein